MWESTLCQTLYVRVTNDLQTDIVHYDVTFEEPNVILDGPTNRLSIHQLTDYNVYLVYM